MPRRTKKKTTRRVKLHTWAKKQRGGFVFTFGAIAAAISAAIASATAGASIAAPIIGPAVLGAATTYATNKVLTKIGGGRKRRVRVN